MADREFPNPLDYDFSQELLTTTETARILHIAPATVRRYIKSGVLEAASLGRPGGRLTHRVKGSSLMKLLHPVSDSYAVDKNM